jgi:hypothetical protein
MQRQSTNVAPRQFDKTGTPCSGKSLMGADLPEREKRIDSTANVTCRSLLATLAQRAQVNRPRRCGE